MKLNIKAFSRALGLVWGFLLMIISLSASMGFQVGMVEVLKHSYPGMEPSFMGSIIAFAWGFVAGSVTGAALAYFYNRSVGKK